MIFLPGTDKQLDFLLQIYDPAGKHILAAGEGLAEIALSLSRQNPGQLQLISYNEQDVVTARMRLAPHKIPVKLMDYTNTDYKDCSFDLVYAQGSFSVPSRRKIFKEVKRILKADGLVCCGEIISGDGRVPKFVEDIWNTSGITPLTVDGIISFYSESGFEVTEQKDLSHTLRDFYHSGKTRLSGFMKTGSEEEKTYHKKLLNKISHEANAYLSLGGDRFMKFHTFILRRIT